MSVTEGEDKPLKYQHMYRANRIMLINKVDLLPYVRFETWYDWLRAQGRPCLVSGGALAARR